MLPISAQMIVTAIHLATLASAAPQNASALDASISALQSSISVLDNSIKSLEGASTPWEVLAIVSSFVVGVGIVGEVIVIVSEDNDNRLDWSRGIVRPPDRSPRWRFWFDIAATVIVLLGVLGEAWGSTELSSINSQLRSKTSELRARSEQLLAIVTREAGDAVTSVNTVERKASNIQTRLDNASSQLASMEDAVRLQGPRWKLLEDGKIDFIAALKPFAGQKALIAYCPANGASPEAIRLTQDIMEYLSATVPNSAGWIAAMTATGNCGEGSSLSGIEIHASRSGGRQVVRAAWALTDALNKLKISAAKAPAPPPQMTDFLRQLEGPDSPDVLASEDLSRIVVSVGGNPETSVFWWHVPTATRIKALRNSKKRDLEDSPTSKPHQ
jgi:hypothetical protein